MESVFACSIDELPTSFTMALLHLCFFFVWFGLVTTEILESLSPKIESGDSIHA